MPTHEVHVDLPTNIVLHADVKFEIWSDEDKLGELLVSKGSIDWIPGKAHTRYHIGWERFDEVMVERGTSGPR